jgi:hypothetical protein
VALVPTSRAKTYTFSSADSAEGAYAGVLSAMRHCQSISRALQTANRIPANAVSAVTARAARVTAFERTWTGVEGISAAGPQIDHVYVAVRAATILVLQFDELSTSGTTAHVYSIRNDPSVLAMLTGLLARAGRRLNDQSHR